MAHEILPQLICVVLLLHLPRHHHRPLHIPHRLPSLRREMIFFLNVLSQVSLAGLNTYIRSHSHNAAYTCDPCVIGDLSLPSSILIFPNVLRSLSKVRYPFAVCLSACTMSLRRVTVAHLLERCFTLEYLDPTPYRKVLLDVFQQKCIHNRC